MPTRAEVVAAARAYDGVRWVHQGRSKAGIDCAGLLIRVHLDLGLPVRDMQGYKRTPDGLLFLNNIRSQTVIAPAPLPGTICVFKETLLPCHVGFFTEKHGVIHILHSFAPQGKVIEEPYDHYWPAKLTEMRDIIGITD